MSHPFAEHGFRLRCQASCVLLIDLGLFEQLRLFRRDGATAFLCQACGGFGRRSGFGRFLDQALSHDSD